MEVLDGWGVSIQDIRWTSNLANARTRSSSMICGRGEKPLGTSGPMLEASQECRRSTELWTLVSASRTSPWKFSKQKIRREAMSAVLRGLSRLRMTSRTPWSALLYCWSAYR